MGRKDNQHQGQQYYYCRVDCSHPEFTWVLELDMNITLSHYLIKNCKLYYMFDEQDNITSEGEWIYFFFIPESFKSTGFGIGIGQEFLLSGLWGGCCTTQILS